MRGRTPLNPGLHRGRLSGESFVALLKKLMFNRKRPVHLIVDGLPAHKKAVVKALPVLTAN